MGKGKNKKSKKKAANVVREADASHPCSMPAARVANYWILICRVDVSEKNVGLRMPT